MKHGPLTFFAAILLAACAGPGTSGDSGASASAAATPAAPAHYDLGTPIDSARLRLIDIDVNPSGVGLPPGSGTATKGVVVFAQQCASCHGAKGEGIAPAPKLVGRDPREGFPFGKDPKYVKTVGNYWPTPTTLYDYIHRAMPLKAPGSLEPDEVYSVVAWLLAENEIISRDSVIDAKTLPLIKMPAAGHFVRDDRTGSKIVK